MSIIRITSWSPGSTCSGNCIAKVRFSVIEQCVFIDNMLITRRNGEVRLAKVTLAHILDYIRTNNWGHIWIRAARQGVMTTF